MVDAKGEGNGGRCEGGGERRRRGDKRKMGLVADDDDDDDDDDDKEEEEWKGGMIESPRPGGSHRLNAKVGR